MLSLNINETNEYLSAYHRGQEDIDMLNWSLGKYIGYAFNSPKKYPKKPFLSKKKKLEGDSLGNFLSSHVSR